MDNPINGDKYVRTLSHYLRTNQRRLLQPTLTLQENNVSSTNPRSYVSPAEPMALAYESVISFWNSTTAAIGSVTPASLNPTSLIPASMIPIISDSNETAPARDAYCGSWDGTGAILPSSSPSESRLYLQAQLRTPIFPLDLYYLLYLLDRFEQVGIELEGWEGVTSRAVGDSTPRVIPPSTPV
ncbi:hypothetical protein BGZ65_009923, partial [Modicella reniformis]